MKLLLDQDVYQGTVRFLLELNHDILQVEEIGMAQASDEEILKAAKGQNRILVTRDRDYGNLVFVQAIHVGVIYLRLSLAHLSRVHSILSHVLEIYSQERLSKSFVVIESTGYRLRDLPNSL
ncbi:DUF5615 family PIN-like protein [Spirulina subsalsa FACHB-351]|uniref:DUF5615 family PIN-like protein n=1 Tax=Spirulina subsalsa FACHB-351 TaxID=234711 RepID=A0ABT3LD50_9CYAN|nr:DUF5615 family PIN-like protein [Spirulina subsalsa]MCW6039039.1 DUF5615 family PIN-like protein [Spirulina subsalsa FACHB-351]